MYGLYRFAAAYVLRKKPSTNLSYSAHIQYICAAAMHALRQGEDIVIDMPHLVDLDDKP